MSFFFIAVLLLFGVTLIVLEVVIVPGIIAGLVGAFFMCLSLFWSFQIYGAKMTISLGVGSLILLGISLYVALNTRIWKRFSLKNVMDGKTNELESGAVLPGDEGYAISSLRPMGTVKIKGRKFEAGTEGALVPPNYPIVVIRVEPGKIIVEPRK